MGRVLVLGGEKSPLSTLRLEAVRCIGGITQVSLAVLNSLEEVVGRHLRVVEAACQAERLEALQVVAVR